MKAIDDINMRRWGKDVNVNRKYGQGMWSQNLGHKNN